MPYTLPSDLSIKLGFLKVQEGRTEVLHDPHSSIRSSRSLFTCQMMLWNTTPQSECFVLAEGRKWTLPPDCKSITESLFLFLILCFSFLYVVSTFPSCLKTPPWCSAGLSLRLSLIYALFSSLKLSVFHLLLVLQSSDFFICPFKSTEFFLRISSHSL